VLVAYTAEAAARGFYTGPVDGVVDFVVNVGYAAAFVVAAVAVERLEREQFRNIVLMQDANARIARQATGNRIILMSAFPAPVLGQTMAVRMHHHVQRNATVGISQIHNFDQWSTGLLVPDIAMVIHVLVTSYDGLLTQHAVERAMTYGDSYVVCAGLFDADAAVDHRSAVIAFAAEQRLIVDRVVEAMEGTMAFELSAAVATGALVGTVVGSVASTLRYVVAGPAFDAAREALAAAAPDEVVVATTTDELHGLSAGDSGASGNDKRSYLAAEAVDSFAVAAPDDAEVVPDDLRWSTVTLAFLDGDLQERMYENFAFPMANVLPVAIVAAGYVAAVLLEQAIPDPRRHHERNPAGLALLLLAFVLSWAHVALCRRVPRLPVAVDLPLTICTFGALAAGLLFLDCFVGYLRSSLMFLSWVRRINGVRWQLQAAVLFVMVMVPHILWRLVLSPVPASAGTLFVLLFAGPSVLVLHRYFSVRAACAQFADEARAESSMLLTANVAGRMASLLGGLLPIHAVPLISPDHLVVQDGKLKPETPFIWDSLSVLQVALHFPSSGDIQAVASVWREVAETIKTVGSGVIELVQATGDLFLLAGPFVVAASDADRVAAARTVTRVIRRLDDVVGAAAAGCAFTAVATAGCASGCMLGAAFLTFRLFGVAVRENNTILAAAPRALGGGNVALASDSFRRQERNFVSVQATDGVEDAAMSSALAPRATSGKDGTDSFGGARLVAGEQPTDRARFLPPVMWRVRGLGVAPVSVIELRSTPTVSTSDETNVHVV
jgi:hypothetical protein